MRTTVSLVLSLLLLLLPSHRTNAVTDANSAGIFMVLIQSGHFQMGQAEREKSFRTPWSTAKDKGADFDEQPVRQIEITRPFSMSSTPITNAQYERFDPAHASKRSKRTVSSEDDAAVVNVNWDDAVAFCHWLSTKENKTYRLPTEAEWEYACRAGTTTLFNTGDTLPDGYQQLLPRLLMGFSVYFPAGKPLPAYYQLVETVSLRVAQHSANAWKLYDMHGPVAEWCQDWYAPYDSAETHDPTGPSAGDFRVLRGGGHSLVARQLRSTNRASMEPWVRNYRIGFRVVQANPTPVLPLLGLNNVSPAAAALPAAREMVDHFSPLFQGPEVFVNIPPHSEGPLFSTHNHDPALTVCPNGDVLAIWYTTDEEVGSELNVASSRLAAESHFWSPAELFWQCADSNNHAPALFTDQDGTIYHFNGNKMLPGAVFRTSKDNGHTWTRALPYNASTQPGEATIRTKDGRLLTTLDGEFWSGVVTATADQGKTWTQLTDDSRRPDFTPGATGKAIAGIHVGLVERQDGTLWALGRFDDLKTGATFDNKLPASISSDGGKTWTYSVGPFAEIRTGQRLTLKRLHEGPLLLCSFTDDSAKRDDTGKILGAKPYSEMRGLTFIAPNGKETTGYGLFAALSFDDGATWPVRRLVTPVAFDAAARQVPGTDGGLFLLDATHAEKNGYLASCQGADGIVHLISSREHYAFNFAWLTEGTPFAPK